MERLILTLKSVLGLGQKYIKIVLDKISKLNKKQLKKDIKTFLVNAKGFARDLLSKPTHYIMHVTVIGLSFFVSISTVYGGSSFYSALAPNADEVTTKVVSQKVNPRMLAAIAGVSGAPIDVNEDSLERNVATLTSALSFSDPSTIDNPGGFEQEDSRNQIIEYTVAGGDTLSTIAKKFSVTTNTIKWANKLSDADSIKPGQVLKILPTVGTMHKVRSGENLDKIASKYSASIPQIIEENGLVDKKDIKEGQVLIIPGGTIYEPPPTPAPTTRLARSTSSNSSYYSSGRTVSWGGGGNKFPYGYCTYYVASRRSIPWRGNAGAWLYNARAMGYATGSAPRAGAIIVTSESPVGHVGIVESVAGGSIRISEMNYAGWGRVSSRTISSGSGVIRGYIY